MKNLENLKLMVNSLEELINQNLFDFAGRIREVVQSENFLNLYKQVKGGVVVDQDSQEIKQDLINTLNKCYGFQKFVYEFETIEILNERVQNYDPTDFFGDHDVFNDIVGCSDFFNLSIYPKFKNIEGVNKAFEALAQKYFELSEKSRPIKEALENSKAIFANR